MMAARTDGVSFGHMVRTRRLEMKLGLRELARKVGMSATYLSKVERDEFKPPAEEKVRAIASALDQHPDELLALAGRVSSDLDAIIKKQPREMATFLRAANELSPEELSRLTKEIENQHKHER